MTNNKFLKEIHIVDDMEEIIKYSCSKTDMYVGTEIKGKNGKMNS